MIAIIDYDAGNIKSVEKALIALGQKVTVTRERDVILKADGVILPGVGSFGDAMHKLHHYGLVDVIQKIVNQDIPFLGICLGMQLLFESSEESPEIDGLSILKGRIYRIPSMDNLKIPHVGWNNLSYANKGRLYQGILEESYVYFVHSFYLQAENEDIVVATTSYGTQIHASVESNNIFACQFHPEKSSDVGKKILENFIKITEGEL